MEPVDPATAARVPLAGRRAPRRSRGVILFALLFLALLLALDALVGDRGVFALIQARKEHAELDAALAAARAQNDRLRDEVRRLQEEDSAIEELARQNLGLVKPGEMLFIVKDVREPRKAPR
jgi:cell division protein FtsB